MQKLWHLNSGCEITSLTSKFKPQKWQSIYIPAALVRLFEKNAIKLTYKIKSQRNDNIPHRLIVKRHKLALILLINCIC